MRLRHNFPIIKTKRYDEFMTTINTALLFDSNDKAKLKLHVITLLEKTDWKTVNLAFPGVSRASAFRWRKQYLDSGKKLSSLIPKSTKPHRVRQMIIPIETMSFIKALRKQYPKLSKYKIKPFLDAFCQERGLKTRSASWIGKLIRKHKYFFNESKPIRKKRRASQYNKQRVRYCPRQKDIKLGYLQLDGIRVDFEGRTYYFLSAIELKTRQAWAKRVGSLSSRNAKVFLENIINQVNYNIHTVQTDNGSEFHKEFDQAIKQLKITHLWSYPHKPKTNGYVERFNGTVQTEFINYEIDTATYNLNQFDQKLNQWLDYYNTTRPHQSLGYMTPQQYLVQLQQEKEAKSLKCV